MLGLGIGWNEAEFAQLGIPFESVPERQRGLYEALEIIKRMFRLEPATFEGETWWTKGGVITSPPVQRPRPPILIAGAGKQTLRQVVEWADISNFGGSRNTGDVKSDQEIVAKLAEIDRLCEEMGRPPETLLRSHFTSWLMMADTSGKARAKLNRYFPDGLTEEQRRTRIVAAPGEIVEYYRSLAALGFRYFVIQIQDSRDLETIELLGREVSPNVA
jgi:alkanesulfonate monooxygenase